MGEDIEELDIVNVAQEEKPVDLNDVEYEDIDMLQVQQSDQQFIFTDDKMEKDDFKVFQNRKIVTFTMHPDSVMHALRAASVAQQSIFAKLSRQQ